MATNQPDALFQPFKLGDIELAVQNEAWLPTEPALRTRGVDERRPLEASMLGEQIAHETGKITNKRVISTPEGMKVEVSFECTGKTLGVPFLSYKPWLFNDRAVAMPTPLEDPASLPSETVSQAMKFGWVWKIPLTNRYGNGYVYSSELDRGFDILELTPNDKLSKNEIEAAKLMRQAVYNPQSQTKFEWPPAFVVVRSYLDQLVRNQGLAPARTTAIAAALDAAPNFVNSALCASNAAFASATSCWVAIVLIPLLNIFIASKSPIFYRFCCISATKVLQYSHHNNGEL